MSILLEDFRLNSKAYSLYNSSIILKGEDACQYLHSQSTNNTKDQLVNTFVFNSILDVAGKIISSFVQCRVSETEFRLLLFSDQVESTFERIEKYHIAEDFDVTVEDIESFLVTNAGLEGFSGTYFFENDIIVLDKPNIELSDSTSMETLTGIKKFGDKVHPGVLINNTIYDELSVDYKKGCYPGQETVSKINTRRGAAYKPVIIECDRKTEIKLEDIHNLEDKKIGNIDSLYFDQESNKTFLLFNALREYRIENLDLKFKQDGKIFEGVVRSLPFLPRNKKELAVELYDHGIELFQSGDDDSAVKYFLKAIEFNPTFEDAFESLGVLYGRLEQYDKAIDLMEQLKVLNPKCMMAFTNLSLYHMKKGNIETAEDYKSQATLLNFQLLGDEADRKKKEEELEKKRLAERDRREGMFHQVLELDAEDSMANNGLGEISLEKKEFENAVGYFQKAIEGNKKYSVAYAGLGKAHYQLGQIEKAKEVLAEGIIIAGKNGDLMPANEMQALLNKIN